MSTTAKTKSYNPVPFSPRAQVCQSRWSAAENSLDLGNGHAHVFLLAVDARADVNDWNAPDAPDLHVFTPQPFWLYSGQNE